MTEDKLPETFYRHYILASESGRVTMKVNLPFLCTQCGNCCSVDSFFSAGYLIHSRPDEEQKKLLESKRTALIERWNSASSEERERIDAEKCVFLTTKNTCEIYSCRPYGCQCFPKTDFGMDSEKGFCPSLDRFRIYKKAIVGRRRVVFAKDYKTFKDNSLFSFTEYLEVTIQPVKLSDKQYSKLAETLKIAGMTETELHLFAKLNNRSESGEGIHKDKKRVI
jgi:Fe-S-cluster containining protein